MTHWLRNGWPTLAIMLGASVWGMIWYPLADAGGARRDRHGGECADERSRLSVRAAGAASRDQPRCAGTGCCPALALAAGITNLGFVWGSIHGQVMRVLLLFYLTPCMDRAIRAFHPA
jgi:hypothetical protein